MLDAQTFAVYSGIQKKRKEELQDQYDNIQLRVNERMVEMYLDQILSRLLLSASIDGAKTLDLLITDESMPANYFYPLLRTTELYLQSLSYSATMKGEEFPSLSEQMRILHYAMNEKRVNKMTILFTQKGYETRLVNSFGRRYLKVTIPVSKD